MPDDDGAGVLLDVGHGTASAEDFSSLLGAAGIGLVVDVRTAPGSRRHPQFGRPELEVWLPASGIAYRWEPALGGFRRPAPDSPNSALRHPSFRGYADYMRTAAFGRALDDVLTEARRRRQAEEGSVALMCAESLWWRCHRRLIADAAELRFGWVVRHLIHDGRQADHRLTEGVRLTDSGELVYDGGGVTLPLDG